jgi:integrase
LKLPIAKKPAFVKIGPGIGLGYRRNQSVGTWIVRVADGKGANATKAFAFADDAEDADGTTILNYWQAQDRAREISRAGESSDEPPREPITIFRALEGYEADLRTRGGDIGNVARVRGHLPENLGTKRVALLTSRDLRSWRDALASHLASASVNRTCAAFKAALNLVADHDEAIGNRRAWETGLGSIPDAEEARNVILADSVVRRVIAGAYRDSEQFGLLVEVAAVTGARVSQLARTEVQDAQLDRDDPRLMIPSSRKGRSGKKPMRRPVPIPTSLASRLQVVVAGRAGNNPLLVKPSGAPWKKSDHSRLFRRTAKAAGQNPSEVTIYALRHSSIVRQLLGGVPVRVVAANHDTSVTMLERTYSRHIGDHSDALARTALLDTTPEQPPDNKVMPLHP